MSNRWMAPLFLLSGTMLAMSCVPSKEDCTKNYTVKDLFTEEECDAAYSDPPPVPGPKIILKKDGGGSYQTYLDSGPGPVLQTPGALAFDTGTLRNDFIGIKISDLTANATSGGIYANANYIAFEKTVSGHVYKIELVRTAGDKARWYASKDGAGRKILTGTETWNDNEVPGEFSDFAPASFVEVIEDVALDSVDYFRVNR